MCKSRSTLLQNQCQKISLARSGSSLPPYFGYKFILFRFLVCFESELLVQAAPENFQAGALSPCTPKSSSHRHPWHFHQPPHPFPSKNYNSSTDWEVSGLKEVWEAPWGCRLVPWPGTGDEDRGTLSHPSRSSSCWFLGSFCSQALCVCIWDSAPHPERDPAHKLIF